MAQYTPSFVNLSGATQALGNAMVQAAQMRYQQDQMIQSQIDDFQKNYNPNKLRDQDLPIFTSAFKNYKEAALRYSRLNRGGAKPEEIAAASAIKDKALNEMNDLYRKSTIASSKEAEYTDWMKNARVRGYMVPDELAANYSTLRNSSAKDIDVENIKSAWDYDFVPREVDIKDLTDAMDKIGGGLKEKETKILQGRAYGKTAGGKNLYYDNIITMSGRNPNAVLTAINAKSISNPAVHNAAKMSYDNFKQALSQNDQNAIDKLNSIKQDFGVTDINKITPAMVYGYDFYAPVVTGMKEDKSRAEQLQQAENEAFDRSYKIQSLNAKDKGQMTFEHPSATINRVANNANSYTLPSSSNVEFTPKTGDKDVTREFSSYTLQNTMGGKTGLKNVLYNPGNEKTKTEPFITYTTYDEPSSPKYSSLEQFNQLLVKASPDVTFKGGQKIYAPKSSATTKSTKKPSKGTRYVGIDAQGNPIFEEIK